MNTSLHLVKPEKPSRSDQDLTFWQKLIDILQTVRGTDKEKIARHLADTFDVYSKS